MADSDQASPIADLPLSPDLPVCSAIQEQTGSTHLIPDVDDLYSLSA